MDNLKIGMIVTVIDDLDAMNNQMGVVVYHDTKRGKVLVRFGGQQQLYYAIDQLKEY